MAEIGWPLIPREVLPAPVRPAARGHRAQRATPHDAGRQLSIFGAETTEPSLLDLSGLLAGPGRLDRMGGTARVAVTVDSAWRVHVLVAELVSRGLVVHWRPVHHQHLDDEVRRVPSPPEPRVDPHTGDNPGHPAATPPQEAVHPAATPPRVAGRLPYPSGPDDLNESVDAGFDAALPVPDDDTAPLDDDTAPPDDDTAPLDDDTAPPDYAADPELDDIGVIGAGVRASADTSAGSGASAAVQDLTGDFVPGGARVIGAGAHGRLDASAHAPDDARMAGEGTRAGRNAATGGAHNAEATGAGAPDAGDPDAAFAAGKAGKAGALDGDVSHPQGRGPGHVLFEVRTAYSSRLNGLARAWPATADQLFLSGPRLRLWVAAAGRPVDGGYTLGLGDHDPATWPGVDGALRRAGLDGELSNLGLDYLIMGRKRLGRLAELVGDRPGAAPAEFWPGGAAA